MKADQVHRGTNQAPWCDVSKCLNASLSLSRIENGLVVTLTATRLDPVFRTGVEIHQHHAVLWPGQSVRLASLGALMILKRKNSGNCHWLASPDRLRLTQSHKVSQYDRARAMDWSHHDKHWSLTLTIPLSQGTLHWSPLHCSWSRATPESSAAPASPMFTSDGHKWWTDVARAVTQPTLSTRGLSAQAHERPDENGAASTVRLTPSPARRY